MARRRKKSRAAANAKMKKDDGVLVDKSLPALPPTAKPSSSMTTSTDIASRDTDTTTELSPRPLQTNDRNGSSSRSSSKRPQEQSPKRNSSEAATSRDGLVLPTATHRKNRHSAISQASDIMNGGDADSFYIPLALDPSPASTITPPIHPANEPWSEPPPRRNREERGGAVQDKDYFNAKNSGRNQHEGQLKLAPREHSASPHIAFQEKGRQPSTDEAMQIKDSIRKAQAASTRGESSRPTPPGASSETRVQHADSGGMNGSAKTKSDRFKLGDVPKGKRSASSRSDSVSELPGDSAKPSILSELPGDDGTPRLSELAGDNGASRSMSELPTEHAAARTNSNGGLSDMPLQKASGATSKASSTQSHSKSGDGATPRSSQDLRLREDSAPRPSNDTRDVEISAPSKKDSGGGKSITRKEVASGSSKDPTGSMVSPLGDTSPSSSSSDTLNVTPTVNGKSISGPTLLHSPEKVSPPTRATARSTPAQQMGDSYMAPRAPPMPPPPPPPASPRTAAAAKEAGTPASPKLPRWSAGGDFTMDEDMARILGETDDSSQSILRRVSNAVRHGRNTSEASIHARQGGHGRSVSETTTRTATSPRWPKTPLTEESARDISSPISFTSPSHEDPATLRRQLRNSEQRVAELERQFATDKDLKNLNKKVQEKRKTVSVLDSQTEIMLRQLEVLAGYVERAKDSKRPLNIADLEDSAIKEFVQKLEDLRESMSGAIEVLYEERNELTEEKNQIISDRDRALVEFEQLSSKNAQLADMNNDLTHQIQERFKAQSGGNSMDSPRTGTNGLGIYTQHNKNKSNVSVHLDDTSLRPSTSTAVFGSVNTYPHPMDQDSSMEPATVLSAPHVVNIRKGQAKKFNWKKGGQSVAKGVSKGFKGAFSSSAQERSQWQNQGGESIGMPYSTTVAPVDSTGALNNASRSASNDAARQGGFALFKKSNTLPKMAANGGPATTEHPSILFGSDLVDRADYERRQIPSVVTRCIEEVELRGMDIEGIYRKTGGSGQVKMIQDGFDKSDDYDISDPGIDITAVSSVLKQYFRKLPNPLLTFEVYDRILESTCEYANLDKNQL